MIQRVQTLYLLLGCLAIAAVFLFDAAWPGGHTDAPSWLPLALFITGFITVLIVVWAILLYRDRRRQHRVVLYAQLLTLAFIACLLVGMWQAQELTMLSEGPEWPWKVLAVLLPFSAYVFFFLARRGIERDIELVRSMDRLR